MVCKMKRTNPRRVIRFNKAAPGNGAAALLFQSQRCGRAVPEPQC